MGRKARKGIRLFVLKLERPVGNDGAFFVMIYALLLKPSPVGRGLGEGLLLSRKLIKYARELRLNQTDAEASIWSHLRNRQLHNAKFRRQIAIDPYIVDFICTDHMLIIELDGGQHTEQNSYDETRTSFLESRGYRVLRFWNNDVLANTEGVLDMIMAELKKSPSPSAR